MPELPAILGPDVARVVMRLSEATATPRARAVAARLGFARRTRPLIDDCTRSR
jgi:hypothetical protein